MEQRLIDKDKLVESMVWRDDQGMILSIDDVLDTIDTAPTIDPESLRPHGKWVKEPFSSRCVCTNCKSVFSEWICVYNYCPLCGARMMKEVAADIKQRFWEMMKNETKVD